MGWTFRLDPEEFEAVKRALRGFSARFAEEKAQKMARFGEDVAEEMRRRIEAQELDVPALRPSTLEKKRREHHDSRILIRTGTYKDSIRYAVSASGEVRVYPDGKDPIGHQSYGKIARFLEYGTRTQLPRPHLGPVGEWARRTLLPRYAAEIAREALNRRK